MVDVHSFGFRQVSVAVWLVADTGVSQCEHIETMDAVHLVEAAVPDL